MRCDNFDGSKTPAEVQPLTSAEREAIAKRSADLRAFGTALNQQNKETCPHPSGQRIRCKTRRGFFFICKRCKQRITK